MKRGALVLFAALMACLVALGEGGSLSGSFGTDADFLYDGVAWNFSGGVTLSLTFANVGVRSRTEFSFAGFEAEKLDFLFTLEDVFLIRNGLAFDPCFSRYELELSGSMFQNGCCAGGFDWRTIFVYANLASPCQTPDYTIGFVFGTGLTWYLDECCTYFEIRNYLSFGVGGLYYLVDDDYLTWIYPVPGVFFEEDLLTVSLKAPAFLGETMVFFDVGGFQWARFTGRITLAEAFDLGGRVTFVSPFTFSTGDFIFGINLDGFSARSITTFDLVGFLSEELRFELESNGFKGFLWLYFDVFGVIDITTGLEVSW